MNTEINLKKKALSYSRISYWCSAGRDLLLIFAGLAAFIHTPSSITTFGITGFLAVIWVSMLGGGATLSLIGLLSRRTTLEIFGSSAVAGSFILWAISLLNQPEVDFVSVTLCFVFLSSALLQFYRISTLPVVRAQ